MSVDAFTGPVRDLIARAKAEVAGKPFSDIVDADGNQYVDLVMSGGGVLGIALVGYTYALEKLGVRFLRLGGASAGAINALAMAALGVPAEEKSVRLTEILADLDMKTFVDGPAPARALIDDFLNTRAIVWKALDAVLEYRDLVQHLGLNPGDRFSGWLSGVLREAGVFTAGELREKMRTLPDKLRYRGGRELTVVEADAHLGVVATDISTETKAVFPKMAPLYWAEPDAVDPALFVRASMAVPVFFHPFRVSEVPQGAAARERWREAVGHERYPSSECAFVDGGILSNFPADLFHEPAEVPVAAPTFGVKLGSDAPAVRHFNAPMQFLEAVFNSARHALDNDFIARNPDFRQLVGTVNTGDANWLDFALTSDAKIDLFRRGAEAAVEFLRGFDWSKYKDTRKSLAAAHRAAGPPAPTADSAGPDGAA